MNIVEPRPITGSLSIVETIEDVSCKTGSLGTRLAVPGHIYVTNRGLLWSSADRPLHNVGRRRLSVAKVRVLRYFSDPDSPRHLEFLFEDILASRMNQSRRQKKKDSTTLLIQTLEKDIRLITVSQNAQRIHAIVQEKLGQKAEETSASLDDLIFYLDRSMLGQLFAATHFGTVSEFITEVSEKAKKGIATEVGAGFVLKLGATLEQEVGRKRIVKEKLSDVNKLALVALDLAQTGRSEHLFSIDLGRDPKPYVHFDQESQMFKWQRKGDQANAEGERTKYTLVSKVHGIIDVTMTLDGESVIHAPTLSILLDIDMPKIQGIAKVASFNRDERRLELLPLSIAA